VDDRYETVKAIAGEPSLSKVQVYMADWCVTAHSALKEACNVDFEWSQHGAQSTFSQLQIYQCAFTFSPLQSEGKHTKET
jgi:hypothetical protein